MSEQNSEIMKQPHEIEPMDKEQFAFALNIAMHAGHRSMPVKNPEQFSLNIYDDETGDISEISLVDNPMNRAGIAVKGHFEDDSEQLHNFMMRFLALLNFLDTKKAKDWIMKSKKDPEMEWIHPAVIDSAAEFSMNKKGKFPLKSFLKQVERIAEADYSHLEEPE